MSAYIDLAIRLKNGYMAEKETVLGRYSRLNEDIIKILKKEGYIQDFSVITDGNKKTLSITLMYHEGKPAVQDVKIYSRPGQRRYAKKEEIRPVLGGLGVSIISTPSGVKTDKQARKDKTGGEILFSIW